MADEDTAKPTTDELGTPPTTSEIKPATEAEPESGSTAGTFGQARQSARDNLSGFGQQASDKAREFAETGKERAGGLLDQLAQMLTDAAGQVDDRLGAQFGDHARTAATSIQGFAQTVRDKNVDEFADDVRGYVSKSPAVALGIAAALGFGLARLVHSGLDQRS